MVFMTSLSARCVGAEAAAILPRWGVDIDLVTCLFIGVGVKERREEGMREGVMAPPFAPPCCPQGAAAKYLQANSRSVHVEPASTVYPSHDAQWQCGGRMGMVGWKKWW